MIASGGKLVYRRLRAPAEDRQALFDPALSQSEELFCQNRQNRLLSTEPFAGQSWSEFSRRAQREFLELALRYTSTYLDVPEPAADQQLAIVLTGHQPQLYHPGVWLKNFVASSVAQRVNAWSINLLIDSDTLSVPAIRVPAGTVSDPRTELIEFDIQMDEVPYEERNIRDFSCWTSFPCRTRRCIGQFVAAPLIARMWPCALHAAQECGNVGQCISRARHRLESDWGVKSLELPLSHLARSRSFSWFAWFLLSELPRFREAYNGALEDYRQVHRIRSRVQPIPNLAIDGEWQETPFWIWSTEYPHRKRLFVRDRTDALELWDGPVGNRVAELVRDPEGAIEQLSRLALQGWKIRPRALITTLFARCCLSDLFVHGIGGAKYDQVTDLIITRFFGIQPPEFLTTTATVRLPIQHPAVSLAEVRQVEQELRELKFTPERSLSTRAGLPDDVRRILAEKQAWIAQNVPPRQGKPRFRAIRDANLQLQPYVVERREALQKHRAELALAAARHGLLGSREYAFALFPEKFLRETLLELSSFAL